MRMRPSKGSLKIALFVTLLMPTRALAGNSKTEWILKQSSDHLGSQTLYVAPDAIKIHNDKYDFYLLAKAPAWKLYIYRTDEKLVATLKEFRWGNFMPISSHPIENAPKPNASFVVRWLGMNCTKNLYSSEYTLVADDIAISPIAAHIFCDYASSWRYDKLPIASVRHHSGSIYKPKQMNYNALAMDTREGEVKSFETLSCQRMALNPSDFKLPTGFATAKDVKTIVFSSAERSKINDFINDLGFTDATQSLAKHKP